VTGHAQQQLLVVDASVVVAALTGAATYGAWAMQTLADAHLAAPDLLPFEVANVLRRHQVLGTLGPDVATLAHTDLLDLVIELFPYEAVADRVWELRGSLPSYDASYIALAERLDAPLATVDARLTRAHGPTCRFITPPG
jgi:predicted nucleic acid-binding protein